MYPFSEGLSPFAMNRWYIAAWSSEVNNEAPMERWICGKRLVFYRNSQNKPIALDGLCSHRRYPLALGKIKGDELVCGYHGFTFCGTGECVRIPTQTQIPAGSKLGSYPLVERWKWIWIWPGDPALADESLIPDHAEIGLTDPEWCASPSFDLTLKARYELLHENLLDLSHITFLHADNIGIDEIAAAEVEVTEEKGYLRNRRIMRDVALNEIFAAAVGAEMNVDRSITIDYYYPSLHVAWERWDKPNHAWEDDHCVGQIKLYHGVTPATEHTTNYFLAHSRTIGRGNDGLNQMMDFGLRLVATQDEKAIEAIEEVLSHNLKLRPDVLAKGDIVAMRGRRILEGIIRSEAEPASKASAG
jgi:phenylpropionate dioxygenase-like ring-hydroxylating dioxygenase large terminal subunit